MSPTKCPRCKSSLKGEAIPQDQLQYYVGSKTTHYSRIVGVEISEIYDGVLYWMCPDCGFAWARQFGMPSRDRQSEQAAATSNAKRPYRVR